MIDIDNQTKHLLPTVKLEKICNSLTNKDIELIICDNTYIQEINHTHRNINKPTDVLSFPLEDHPLSPLGSIIISYDYVIDVAKSMRHSCDDELLLLFIHGMLHLLGYDHETDQGEMRKKEESLIQQFSLPQSLIVRSEDS